MIECFISDFKWLDIAWNCLEIFSCCIIWKLKLNFIFYFCMSHSQFNVNVILEFLHAKLHDHVVI